MSTMACYIIMIIILSDDDDDDDDDGDEEESDMHVCTMILIISFPIIIL